MGKKSKLNRKAKSDGTKRPGNNSMKPASGAVPHINERLPAGQVGLSAAHTSSKLPMSLIRAAKAAVVDGVQMAIDSGDENALRNALQVPYLNTVVVNAHTHNGPIKNVSIVHRTVITPHIQLLSVLLDVGFSANAVDSNGSSPLHWAVGAGRTGMTEALLSAGADPHKPDAAGRTPLILAAVHDCTETVHALLAAGADPDMVNEQTGLSALDTAEDQGSQQAAAILRHVTTLQGRAFPQNRRPHIVDTGYARLHNAAALGDLPLIKILLDAGADPFLTTALGLCASMVAVLHGHHEAAAFLLMSKLLEDGSASDPLIALQRQAIKALNEATIVQAFEMLFDRSFTEVLNAYVPALEVMGFDVAPKQPH